LVGRQDNFIDITYYIFTSLSSTRRWTR